MTKKIQSTRRSYSGLYKQPAWLLYNDTELVASVRAHDIEEASNLFKTARLKGTHVTKSRQTRTHI